MLALFLFLAGWYETLYCGQVAPSLVQGGQGLFFFLGVGLIPFGTPWGLTGNPVFPFFNKVFQSFYYPAVNFDSASIFGKGLTWDILYRSTFESGKYLEANAGAS